MSTQDGSGIPLEISNEQDSFRLLELPPSLLELITSKQLVEYGPQSCDVLAVRQVQSSNSVYIVKPLENGPEEDAIPSSSLVAIAKCGATLELIPATPSGTAFLKNCVAFYKGPRSCIESALALEVSSIKSKSKLLEDTPFSSGEFDKAWKELCAFEEDGKAWVPTPATLIAVWMSILSAATVRSLDLGESFSLAALVATVEEDGHPMALFQAVVNRLGSDDGNDLVDGYSISITSSIPNKTAGKGAKNWHEKFKNARR
ncbi:sister chromatid cohesion protein DCC1, partial [Lecanoromycetidae sp. Uapishka_2]